MSVLSTFVDFSVGADGDDDGFGLSGTAGRGECQRSIESMMFDKISVEAASADVTVDVTEAKFLRRRSDLAPPIVRDDDITNKPSRFAIELLFKSTSFSLSSEKYSNAFLSPNRWNFGGYFCSRVRAARELLPNFIASEAAVTFELPRAIRRPVHFFAFRLTLRRRLITFLVLLMLNLLSKLSTSYSST